MKKLFISEFFKERKMVGAIAPSSNFLMKKMLGKIDFTNDLNIIELGAGTGIFTAEILRRMTKRSKLLSFEINPVFFNKLNAKYDDDRVHFIYDSAEKMKDYLIKYKLNKVDFVISSLPLAVIPLNIKDNILNSAVNVLDENGSFVQFQYSLNAKKLLHTKFQNINIEFTALNLPPAFVYHCNN